MERKPVNRRMASLWLIAVMVITTLAGCGSNAGTSEDKRVRVGVMLSDVGLGDQSYSDAAFAGLVAAREELGIVFDYRELEQVGTFDQGFEELVQDSDMVIGLGFQVKDSLEAIAKKHPDFPFVIVDETSELPNVTSITFKEEEGSYLVGLIAGLKTRSDKIGFLGGVDAPLIHKFQAGFEQGVKAVNPEAELVVEYAGTFGDADLGGEIAGRMFREDSVDIVYAAAGFTGVGALQEAEKQHKLAIGVDTDQFFVAEKAVVTSMMKNVDVAIRTTVETFLKNEGRFPERQIVFGLKDNAIGVAPIRVVPFGPDDQQLYDEFAEKLAAGSTVITLP
ncbi:BMP family lipoprotein [Paenibacillus tarimensis]|uniref:BMP family lipoprotein n=1 Tax=Paenibacillus tarimensis TaxID=416012 RepID=UPI001F4374F4|nr:BMP family ABC transporter substrate-binding protein [Paenibacillus tarimensis]MCF2944361.1 BMP family ABC transporter substrate-binding protein [Paenibacillus tarimensis]